MAKELTITLDDAIYNGLCDKVPREDINAFFDVLLRPRVLPPPNLAEREASYREQAADEAREFASRRLNEVLVGGRDDEAWWSLVGSLWPIPWVRNLQNTASRHYQ